MKTGGIILNRKARIRKGEPYIVPISIFIHLALINGTFYFLTPDSYFDRTSIIGINLSWFLITMGINFYRIERQERFITRFHMFLRHYFLFTLAYIALFAFKGEDFFIDHQFFVLSVLFLLLAFYRWAFFFIRKIYRKEGGNYVKVVVIGYDRNLQKMLDIFNEPDFGYRYKGYFHGNKCKDESYLGTVESSYEYILKNEIDEIYCLASQLSRLELKKLINFSDNNFKKVKIVPDNKEVFTRAMNTELFGSIPVFNVRNSPLEKNYAKYGKRIFDVLFSSLVIIFLLSWLTPILSLLIYRESPGPLFFRQRRNGYNKRSFWCYKFRSMAVNTTANSQGCIKNDPRITKLGRILRKTNIDELPQFLNVFLGDMSVVGPRPHMEAHTASFSQSVDKYLVRHFAKPGITGLAQVKGYRGEITCKSDIINRTRLDIFYLEKWSFMLDFFIIYTTISNCIRGEEKAY